MTQADSLARFQTALDAANPSINKVLAARTTAWEDLHPQDLEAIKFDLGNVLRTIEDMLQYKYSEGVTEDHGS